MHSIYHPNKAIVIKYILKEKYMREEKLKYEIMFGDWSFFAMIWNYLQKTTNCYNNFFFNISNFFNFSSQSFSFRLYLITIALFGVVHRMHIAYFLGFIFYLEIHIQNRGVQQLQNVGLWLDYWSILKLLIKE